MARPCMRPIKVFGTAKISRFRIENERPQESLVLLPGLLLDGVRSLLTSMQWGIWFMKVLRANDFIPSPSSRNTRC
jgi:hypothetical protein